MARRCVDHGELLGTALRDRPRAVLVDASLPWVDRDLVTTLRRAGIETIAIGTSARPLEQIGVHCLPAEASPEAVSTLVFGLDVSQAFLNADTADRSFSGGDRGRGPVGSQGLDNNQADHDPEDQERDGEADPLGT